MESHPAELLRDALALPPDARSALTDSLIESLDTTVDEGATDAWKREIELRLKQIDDGTWNSSPGASHEDAFATGWNSELRRAANPSH